MNLDEYKTSVMRTARTDLPDDMQICNILLGLSGEVGEVVDLYKKHLFQGHDIDLVKVINEVGDVLFYLTWLAEHQGFDLQCAMAANKSKLEKRYPVDFNSSNSVNRIE